jgi:hypothetical protein
MYHGCGLAYPYDGKGFLGSKKKNVGLLVFSSSMPMAQDFSKTNFSFSHN